MTDTLETLSQDMIPAVEGEMRAVLKTDEMFGDPFYGMMHYHMGWANQHLEPAETSSGKRVRPLLCLLACGAAGGNWRQAVPGAASIELLHNFSLIHDDIQDASPTRRGRMTLWKIWGVNLAINSGDSMFALSHLAMTRMLERGVSAETIVRALRCLDETSMALTIGQHADMSFERRAEVTVPEYLAMIDRKTAALISFSTELGALVAGCGEETVEHYAAFGRDLGLAFQVRDDILGIWGEESVIGKSAATDISARKKSLPVLYGLSQNEELSRLYLLPDTDEEFVGQVVELLDSAGARTFAETYENNYANSALRHLKAAGPDGPAAAALHQLAGKLLNRQA